MSKELEAFRKIKEYLVNLQFHFLEEELDIIETALKEYEEHKQILNDYGLSLFDFRHACFTFVQFKNSKGFEGVEKKLKALKIIKEKEVNVYILQWYLKHSSYEQYADDFERNRRDCDLPDLGDKILTQEEYDLLKEVLL